LLLLLTQPTYPRLGAGKSKDADMTYQEWDDALKSSRQKSAYQLRMHVFQGRSLPASDANGLMDPYFKINFNGMNINTKNKSEMKNGREVITTPSMIRKMTLDPLWYQTFTFDTQLPDPQFFPQVNFQLFDWDGMLDADDYAGCFNAVLTEKDIVDADAMNGMNPPEPKW